jgi:hypothetical protein
VGTRSQVTPSSNPGAHSLPDENLAHIGASEKKCSQTTIVYHLSLKLHEHHEAQNSYEYDARLGCMDEIISFFLRLVGITFSFVV